MIPTTVGLGPFKPAIRWYDRLWVAGATFESEDEAASVADGVITYLNMQAVDYISGLGYEPQRREG